MKAIVYHQYGTPDVLTLQELEQPQPKDDEVLIEVCATSVNASDWELLTGKPLYARIWGLFKPKYTILGSDIAGRVVKVGKNVRHFQVGDKVFGDNFERWGGFAEYVCVSANSLIHIPENMSFEQAASIPQAAVVALQGLRDKGNIKIGHKVLINGAGGGSGSFAIQLANYYGAEVTAVDNTGKLDFMRSLGADHVVDYRQQDFIENRRQYDVVLDFVASQSVFRCKQILRAGGKYIVVGGSVVSLLQVAIIGMFISLLSKQKIAVLSWRPNTKDLTFLVELFKTGKVVPVIDKCYALIDTPKALQRIGKGDINGKVVIILEHEEI